MSFPSIVELNGKIYTRLSTVTRCMPRRGGDSSARLAYDEESEGQGEGDLITRRTVSSSL